MPQRANTHAGLAIKNFSFHNKNAHLGIFCSLPWGVLLIPSPGRGGATRRGGLFYKTHLRFVFFMIEYNYAKAEKREYTGMMAFAAIHRFFCLGRPIIPILLKVLKINILIQIDKKLTIF